MERCDMEAPNPKPCYLWETTNGSSRFAMTNHQILHYTMRSDNMVQGKHQIPNKSQSLKSKTKSLWSFEFGIWSLFEICLPAGRQGICDLEF